LQIPGFVPRSLLCPFPSSAYSSANWDTCIRQLGSPIFIFPAPREPNLKPPSPPCWAGELQKGPSPSWRSQTRFHLQPGLVHACHCTKDGGSGLKGS
jgi:hypothetical protein